MSVPSFSVNGTCNMSAKTLQEEVVESPEVHFEPIVKLAPVAVKTMEENEEEVFKM